MAPHPLDFGDPTASGWDTVGAPGLKGPPVQGKRVSVPSLPRRAPAKGLVLERERLCPLGLPAPDVQTMSLLRHPPRLPSWRYGRTDRAWHGGSNHGHLPWLLSTQQGQFLFDLMVSQGCPVTYNSQARLPSSPLGSCTRHPLEPPFEPLEDTDLQWLFLKTVFLLAIKSARRISKLHALLVHRDFCRWLPDGKGVVFWPNLAFLLKALSEFHLSQFFKLQACAWS